MEGKVELTNFYGLFYNILVGATCWTPKYIQNDGLTKQLFRIFPNSSMLKYVIILPVTIMQRKASSIFLLTPVAYGNI